MSTVDGQSGPGGSPSSEPADLKLEAVVIPVVDADRSKPFPSISTIFDLAFKAFRMEIATMPPPSQPMKTQMARR